MGDLLNFDNTNAQAGSTIHFSNLQAEDLYLVGPIVTRRGLLNKDVHRIFEQKYRPISVFSSEQIYHEITAIGLGQNAKIQLNITGDLIYSLALTCVFPDYAVNTQVLDTVNYNGDLTRYTHSKFGYVTNLGSCLAENIIFTVDSSAIDQQLTTQSIITNNLLRRKDQRDYYNDLIGNTIERCNLESSKSAFKIMAPIQLFFSDSPQKSFSYLRAGQPNIYIQTKLRSVSNLLCMTRNLAAVDFNNGIKATKLGYVTQEIYVSEQERLVHANIGVTNLIEQNVWFSGTFGQNTQQFTPNQFVHPCKWLAYGVQKVKYQSAQPYLAYQPNIEGNQNDDDLLAEATQRFVLKFASYTASVDYSGVAAYTALSPAVLLTGATSAISAGILDDAVILPIPTSNVLITFTEDANGIIKSCFDGVNYTEQNTSQWNINDIFKRVQPWAITTDGVQRFMRRGSVILQNGLLTIAEASRTVDTELKNHLPQVPGFRALTPLSASVAQFTFSLYSQGDITFTYGSTNQFPGVIRLATAAKTGSTLFSNIIKENKFNYGLDDFDVLVTQWDNFGKFINGTGDLITSLELSIGSVQRFKLAGFYTQRVHQMKYFPGKSPKGVHIQSFALDPFALQPSGTLNFTKSNCKLNVVADIDINDVFFMTLLVYNVMELREGVSQVLYNTPLN